MLILTRRVGESIYINDDIKVTIVGSVGNQVRIGIDAPPEVSIDREELYLRKRYEAQQATNSDAHASAPVRKSATNRKTLSLNKAAY